MDSRRERLLTKSMGSLFAELALPAVAGMVAIGLYQLVDAIFVGRMVDTDALGAISLVYPLTLINNGIATLVGIGSSSILSRAMGAKDNETIRKVFGNLSFWIIVLSVVSTILLFTLARPLIAFMGAEPGPMREYAVTYLKIVALGSLFVNFAQGSNMLIRGEGKMAKAMGIMAGGTIVNIILDPIMIGPMGLGIAGAAWATVISQVLMAVLCAVYFYGGKSAAQAGSPKPEKSIMGDVLKVGVSAMAMQVMMLVQQTLLYKSIAAYGQSTDIAVAGSAMRLMSFAFIPVWGMSQGLQPVVGMNYGAGNYDRVRAAYRFFSLAGTIFCGVAWLAFILFPKFLLGWFMTDASIINAGAPIVRTMLAVFLLSGIMIMSITLFQAVGKAGEAAALTFGRQLILFAPAVLILPLFFGLNGVFLSMPIVDTLTTAVALIFVGRLFTSMRGASPLKRED